MRPERPRRKRSAAAAAQYQVPRPQVSPVHAEQPVQSEHPVQPEHPVQSEQYEQSEQPVQSEHRLQCAQSESGSHSACTVPLFSPAAPGSTWNVRTRRSSSLRSSFPCIVASFGRWDGRVRPRRAPAQYQVTQQQPSGPVVQALQSVQGMQPV